MSYEAYKNTKKQMRAYLRITEEQGPSEQLISFINYDGKLGSEIGLESFDSLSLQTRHEILRASFTKETSLKVALESFGDKLKSFSKWWYAAELYTLKGKEISDLIHRDPSKMVPKKSLMLKAVEVIPYSSFVTYKNFITECISLDKQMLQKMPSGFSANEWESYYNKYQYGWTAEWDTPAANKYYQIFEESKNIRDDRKENKVDFDKSGWNPNLIVSEAKILVSIITEIEKQEKEFVPKLKKLQAWFNEHEHRMDHEDWDNHNDDKENELDSLVWYMSKSLVYWKEAFSETRSIIDHAEKILKQASLHYDYK